MEGKSLKVVKDYHTQTEVKHLPITQRPKYKLNGDLTAWKGESSAYNGKVGRRCNHQFTKTCGAHPSMPAYTCVHLQCVCSRKCFVSVLVYLLMHLRIKCVHGCVCQCTHICAHTHTHTLKGERVLNFTHYPLLHGRRHQAYSIHLCPSVPWGTLGGREAQDCQC